MNEYLPVVKYQHSRIDDIINMCKIFFMRVFSVTKVSFQKWRKSTFACTSPRSADWRHVSHFKDSATLMSFGFRMWWPRRQDFYFILIWSSPAEASTYRICFKSMLKTSDEQMRLIHPFHPSTCFSVQGHKRAASPIFIFLYFLKLIFSLLNIKALAHLETSVRQLWDM